MHPLHGISQHCIDGSNESLVLRTLVIRIDGVLFIKVVVIIHETDGAEAAILLDFPHHTTNAVTIVGIVLHRQADSVIACGYEFAVGGHIPAHPLVHDGF